MIGRGLPSNGKRAIRTFKYVKLIQENHDNNDDDEICKGIETRFFYILEGIKTHALTHSSSCDLQCTLFFGPMLCKYGDLIVSHHNICVRFRRPINSQF